MQGSSPGTFAAIYSIFRRKKEINMVLENLRYLSDFCQSHTVKNKLSSLILDIFWKNVENEQTSKERNCSWKLSLLTSRSDSAKNTLTFIYASS